MTKLVLKKLVRDTLNQRYSGLSSSSYVDRRTMATFSIVYAKENKDEIFVAVRVKEPEEKKVYSSIFGYSNEGENIFSQDIYEPVSDDNLIDLTDNLAKGFKKEKDMEAV